MFEGRYFVSLLAIRCGRALGTTEAEHHLCVYDRFNSEDEARGRASAVIEKLFPRNAGWDHHIQVLAHDAPNPAKTEEKATCSGS